MRTVPIIGTTLLAAAGLAAAPMSARGPVLRDVQGYAVATCLARQNNAYLKEQGEGWANTIVERGHGDPAALRGVDQAVRVAVAKGGMVVMRVDGPKPGDRALPVLFCSEIVDQPGVRAAVDRAVSALSSSYHGR